VRIWRDQRGAGERSGGRVLVEDAVAGLGVWIAAMLLGWREATEEGKRLAGTSNAQRTARQRQGEGLRAVKAARWAALPWMAGMARVEMERAGATGSSNSGQARYPCKAFEDTQKTGRSQPQSTAQGAVSAETPDSPPCAEPFCSLRPSSERQIIC
jgi:hypothetical protein